VALTDAVSDGVALEDAVCVAVCPDASQGNTKPPSSNRRIFTTGETPIANPSID